MYHLANAWRHKTKIAFIDLNKSILNVKEIICIKICRCFKTEDQVKINKSMNELKQVKFNKLEITVIRKHFIALIKYRNNHK